MTTVVRCGSDQAIAAQVVGCYVYIGRPTKWGNPYTIRGGMRRTDKQPRQRVIALFRTYWYSERAAPLRAASLVELRDKALGCHCFPRACHGDVIAEFVNSHARPEPAV